MDGGAHTHARIHGRRCPLPSSHALPCAHRRRRCTPHLPRAPQVQELVASGVSEGARLLVGGVGKPAGYEGHGGFFVRPTLFADVTAEMRVAREEIFGPVLCLQKFATEEEAVAIANGTSYGLTSYLQTGSAERVRRVVPRLKAGMVEVNGARRSPRSPFGGVKQSGNGREGGEHGLREFLEVKAVSGWTD